MDKKHPIILIVIILAVCLFQLTGCFFDPDPGPDATGGSEVNADGDADTDTDTDGGCPPFVYASAPDNDDSVTVVGLKGAVPESIFQVHTWSDSSDDTVIAPVSESSTFAFRIEGQQDDLLFLDMDATAIAKYLLVKGADEALEVEDIFENVVVSQEDKETILVSGNSDLLEKDFLVLGGNVTQSIGMAVPVYCQGECGFEISILGESGDEIDLFLVLEGSCSGLTQAHTLVIP